jgi:ribose transport system permease protein
MATSETPSGIAEVAVRRTGWWEPALKARETGLIVIILALFAVMSFISPYFLTVDNLRAMAMVFAI